MTRRFRHPSAIVAAAMTLMGLFTASSADATILCKDDRKSGFYVCWDEATRYAVHFPRKHPNGSAKSQDEVLQEGKVAVGRIVAHTGRTDRVLLLDQNNRVLEEIPEWKVAFIRGGGDLDRADLEQWKARK